MAVAYRRLRILTPNLGAHYGVVDDEYRPHELASRRLEVRFFGRAQAETTSAQYASSIALFLTWAQQSGQTSSRQREPFICSWPTSRQNLRRPGEMPARHEQRAAPTVSSSPCASFTDSRSQRVFYRRDFSATYTSSPTSESSIRREARVSGTDAVSPDAQRHLTRRPQLKLPRSSMPPRPPAIGS